MMGDGCGESDDELDVKEVPEMGLYRKRIVETWFPTWLYQRSLGSVLQYQRYSKIGVPLGTVLTCSV